MGPSRVWGLDSENVHFKSLQTGFTVALGAGLGALARFIVLIWVGPTTPEALSLATTFAVNLAACFAMGYFAPGAFWGVGFLGGFSTLSAVALASSHESVLWAAFIITLSLTTATLAWLAGDATRVRHRV